MTTPPFESLEELYDDAPCGYLSTLSSGVIGRCNRTFLRLTGWREEDLIGRRRFDELLSRGGQVFFETHLRPMLDGAGEFTEVALDLLRPDGTRLPTIVNASLRRNAQGRPVHRFVVIDATTRRGYERELTQARRAAEHLAAFTARLSSAMTPADVGRAFAEVAPGLFGATAGQIAMADPTGGPLERLDGGGGGDAPVLAEAHRTREISVLGGEVGAPVRAGAAPLGALALRFADEPSLDRRTTRLLHTVADQCAQALDRARLAEADRTASLRLQRALLPDALVRHPDLAIEARYRAASERLEVGGDWYDTFALPDGRIGLVVGDVVGHGIESAAAMGRLRSTFAVLTTIERSPAALLARLDEFLGTHDVVDYATACYAVLDPATGIVRHASAGHPPMVVRDSDGAARALPDGRLPALGFGAGAAAPDGMVTLEPGATLVLYSDGLVERRGEPLDVGITRLTDALAEHPGGDLAALCDDVLARAGDGADGDDDTVVLAAQLAPVSARRFVSSRMAPQPGEPPALA